MLEAVHERKEAYEGVGVEMSVFAVWVETGCWGSWATHGSLTAIFLQRKISFTVSMFHYGEVRLALKKKTL